MKSLNLTREELYDIVWEKSVSHLAEEPGVESSELRGYRIKFEIPLHEQGHWSREYSLAKKLERLRQRSE